MDAAALDLGSRLMRGEKVIVDNTLFVVIVTIRD